VLDAQYFGVAQRRRRVFVVGCLGDWRSAAAVLFESHSLSGNPAPSREKGQAVAGTIAARFGISRNNHEKCVAYVAPTVIGNVEGGAATTLSSREYKGLSCGRDGMTSAAVVYGAIPIHDQATRHAGKHGDKQDGKGNGLGIGQPGDPMNTLTKGDRHAVAQPIIGGVDYENNAHGPDDVTGPLLKGSPTGGGRPLPAVALANMAVRRLTPTECERLQGFPDGYTNIPWRKKDESPDGPRYKALGNSMAVPVMKWIGQRIKQVENV
jgi:DNA (cytosine-5)-methyltransferase 1